MTKGLQLGRRRHIRNETLTIVWNYASTVVRRWYAKARGEAPPPEPNPPRRAIMEHPRDWLTPTPPTPTQATPQEVEEQTIVDVEMAAVPDDNSASVVQQID